MFKVIPKIIELLLNLILINQYTLILEMKKKKVTPILQVVLIC